MAAGWLDLEINQGSTESWGLTIRSNGAAVNITGYTFTGKIRKSATDSKVLGSFAFSITSGVNGQVTASLTSTVTGSLPVNPSSKAQKVATELCYDFEYNTGSSVQCFMQGVLRVWPEGSR